MSLASIKHFERTCEISLSSLIKIAFALGCDDDFGGASAKSAYVSLEDVSVIEEYLAVCGDDMQKENRAILESWKRRIRGGFILERHFKKSFVFISMDDKRVYLVSGITSGWEEYGRTA